MLMRVLLQAGSEARMTDRGRVYVELGPPDQIEAHPSGGPGPFGPGPFEIWRYQRLEQGKRVEEF